MSPAKLVCNVWSLPLTLPLSLVLDSNSFFFFLVIYLFLSGGMPMAVISHQCSPTSRMQDLEWVQGSKSTALDALQYILSLLYV